MKFFTDSSEAVRYARSRPYFHPLAIKRAKKVFDIEKPVSLALDVACGTGQSTKALLSIAERVIGFDISWNMLANAGRDRRICYVNAQAESMPFKSGSTSMISNALSFHWFDRNKFLYESWRVLSPEGLLLIYSNGFRGIMRENPAFQNWGQKTYIEHFPIPPRDSKPLTPEEAKGNGFVFIAEDIYENEVTFTPEELVAYLTTQTNVVAAIEEGKESYESAHHWLIEQVDPFFVNENATFVFVTRAWYLRKTIIQ